jgi:DNA-binding response OmpR family regulator
MKKSILIVEDTADALALLRDLLLMEDLEVITATNGEEAMDKFYLYQIDLVITDLRMPKVDGFALIERIRKREELSSLPVIVFSANATPENEKTCLDLGASVFLKKPCPTETLLATIHACLND